MVRAYNFAENHILGEDASLVEGDSALTISSFCDVVEVVQRLTLALDNCRGISGTRLVVEFCVFF